MRTISDLPGDLVEEEIFSRVPITSLRSVRSTCKKWNSLCKNRILFGKAAAVAARKQFMGFMMMDSRICLMKFDLQGIRNDGNLVDPCIKQVSILDRIEISYVFHCNGLLLCVLNDNSRLLVWNPYLGQRMWIELKNNFHSQDRYALGYDKKGNHKILRIFGEYDLNTRSNVLRFEIYNFSSNSWKVLDVTPDWEIWPHQRGVSLKGNTYFPAQKKITVEVGVGRKIRKIGGFFLCFDFTRENFGPLLPLPFHANDGGIFASLSCVREEQLAVLYQRWETLETIKICVTDKIGASAVSWTKFLELPTGFRVSPSAGSFFIDEEKKIAVVFDLEWSKACCYQTAHIIGQDGYFKSVNIKEAPNLGTTMALGCYIPESYCSPLVCSSYVPSLVQLQIKQQGKGKESDSY